MCKPIFSFVYLFIIIQLILGCADSQNKPPLECDDIKLKNYEEKELGIIKLKIPVSWECDIISNSDGSISNVCLDTALLYGEDIIHSISVTEFNVEQNRSNIHLKNEIKLINEDSTLTLIEYGSHTIDNEILDWIYFKDSTLTSIVYYIYGEKYAVLDFSVSTVKNYEENLCKIAKTAKSLKYF